MNIEDLKIGDKLRLVDVKGLVKHLKSGGNDENAYQGDLYRGRIYTISKVRYESVSVEEGVEDGIYRDELQFFELTLDN